MKWIYIPFAAAALCGFGQQAAVSGEVVGSVVDDGGVSASRITLKLVRQFQPGWAGRWSSITVTAANGSYRFEGVPAGRYTVCAETSGSGYLNPCEWGEAPTFEVRPGARVGFPVALRRGFVLGVVVDDPGGHLDEHETKRTANADFSIGVVGPQGFFRPGTDASDSLGKKKSKTERTFSVLVPRGQTVKLVAKSEFFKLGDSQGRAVAKASGHREDVLVPANVRPEDVPLRRMKILGLN